MGYWLLAGLLTKVKVGEEEYHSLLFKDKKKRFPTKGKI
jgi:hypothetical protein